MSTFTTKVSISDLLAQLRRNRDKHRSVYEEAWTNYRQAVLDETDRQLSDFRAGRVQRIVVNLPVPEDYTEDYDSVIGLLAMSTEKEIDLTQADYETYVLDQWHWLRAWLTNTASYSSVQG